MKYYLHDSNAFNDEKISELYINYGYEGLGLFYTLLEKLSAQEKPVKTIVLKRQLNVGKKLEKCWSFMESIELIHSNNGETFNKQLLNFSEKYQIKKQKNAERISQWRENQEVEKNVTHYESVRNTPKVNISKVKESKVDSKSGDKSPTPSSSLKNTMDARREDFKNELSNYLQVYGAKILNEFYSYWTEPNKSKTKMRWELEKAFEISRRLSTWAQRDKNFSNNKNNETPLTAHAEYLKQKPLAEIQAKYNS